MTIDIDKLTEAELIDLNHRIVERLRFMQHARAHATMLRFSIEPPRESRRLLSLSQAAIAA